MRVVADTNVYVSAIVFGGKPQGLTSADCKRSTCEGCRFSRVRCNKYSVMAAASDAALKSSFLSSFSTEIQFYD